MGLKKICICMMAAILMPYVKSFSQTRFVNNDIIYTYNKADVQINSQTESSHKDLALDGEVKFGPYGPVEDNNIAPEFWYKIDDGDASLSLTLSGVITRIVSQTIKVKPKGVYRNGYGNPVQENKGVYDFRFPFVVSEQELIEPMYAYSPLEDNEEGVTFDSLFSFISDIAFSQNFRVDIKKGDKFNPKNKDAAGRSFDKSYYYIKNSDNSKYYRITEASLEGTYEDDICLGTAEVSKHYTIESINEDFDFDTENVSKIILPTSLKDYNAFPGRKSNGKFVYLRPMFFIENNPLFEISSNYRLVYRKDTISLNTDDIKFSSEKASEVTGIKVLNPALTKTELDIALTDLRNRNISYLDFCNLSNVKDAGNISVSELGTDCQLYLPDGVTATGDNIIIGDTCSKIALKNDNDCAFINPKPFTAKQIEMNFGFGKNIQGYVLPFAYSNPGIDIYTFSGYFDGFLNFTITDNVEANTPFIAKAKNGEPEMPAIKASDASITNVAPSIITHDVYNFTGTYKSITNNPDSKSSLYGFKNGELQLINGDTLPPFCAYFIAPEGFGDPKIRLFDSVDDYNGIDNEEMPLINIYCNHGEICIYANGNYVSVATLNGTAIYKGHINGKMSITAQPGMYIVNGNKVIVY